MNIDTSLYLNYVVTGVQYHSRKRFAIYTDNIHHALGINLWNGSVWGIRKDNGRRQRLKRVIN